MAQTVPSVLTGAADDAKWDTPSESHEGNPEPRSGWTSGERMIGVGTWEMGWGRLTATASTRRRSRIRSGARSRSHPGTLRAVHVVLDGYCRLPTEHVLVTLGRLARNRPVARRDACAGTSTASTRGSAARRDRQSAVNPIPAAIGTWTRSPFGPWRSSSEP